MGNSILVYREKMTEMDHGRWTMDKIDLTYKDDISTT